MIKYDKERHLAANRAFMPYGNHSERCRNAGRAIGLATWIMARGTGAVLVIDSTSHVLPAGAITIDGRGLVFHTDTGEAVVMPIADIGDWGMDHCTNGASFCFGWRDAEGRERDVALLPSSVQDDDLYAIGVECALLEALSETNGHWHVSDLARSIGHHDAAIRIEPARRHDEVPGADHVMRYGDETIRIADVVALETVREDGYQEHHVVTSDGRYRRFAFGGYDR